MYVFSETGSGGAVAPNMASIVGYVPAGYNMLPTPGVTQGFQTDWTDFTNTTNWLPQSAGGGATGQVTLVTGFSGPDHSSHATKLVESTGNSQHGIYHQTGLGQLNGLNAPIPFRVAAICRAVERTRAVLDMPLPFGTGPQYQISVGYDLAGGNTGYDNAIGTNLTLIGTHMTSLSGGWWLCYFDWFVSSGALTPLTTVNNQYYPDLLLDNGSGTAARSVSYTGNGSSGIEVLWFNMLPVAMWNMTVEAFQDDFTSLSTIDLTNSKAPGFKWYINNQFPNSGPWGGVGAGANFWNTPGVNIPSTPSNFSISSPSVLQMYEPTVSASAGFTNQLWSVVSTSSTPGTIPGYIGTALPAPLLFEWSVANTGPNEMNPGTFNPYWQGDGIVLWGSSIPGLVDYGFAADPGGYHMLEWDIGPGCNPVRVANGAGGEVTHDHQQPLPPNFGEDAQQSYGVIFPGSAASPLLASRNGFRKAAGLWVNQAYNNYTWGFFMAFGDGQWTVNDGLLPYNPAGNASPSVSVGTLSLTDGHLMPLFIVGAGSNNNLAPTGVISQIDWVRAWTVPIIPTVYAFWNTYDMGTAGAAGLTSTLSQNGYQVTKPGSDTSWQSARAHMNVGYNKIGVTPSAGKWYWEHTLTGNSVGNTSDFILGFGNTAATVVGSYPGSSAKGAGLQYNTAANTNVNGVTGLTASTITWASGDVIGFAFDANAGHVYVHKNGTYINGNPGSGNGVWTVSGDTWWPMAAMKTAGSTNAVSSNFGQAAFAFTVPTGYNAGVF